MSYRGPSTVSSPLCYSRVDTDVIPAKAGIHYFLLSPRGLTTVSSKTNKNTKILIF
ncbi:palindromic element RPE4 domain-containing protein [Rickettsia sp.]|uniref:palindromic element RPE4 domain-containing protein n=1 Tax=Rickettsia sp. TaxID=789 RepID=UPI00397A3A10